MSAEVDITEGDIKSVAEGQRADITVDAIPDKTWEGRVERVSTMATSQRRFGPDVKVYETAVKLEGRVTELKPGMSATAEIYVADLKDVLSIPIQAVTTYQGNRVVWVRKADTLKLHQVRTGHFSDTKIEIKAGLSDGDTILLASPDVPPADVPLVELPLSEKKPSGQEKTTPRTRQPEAQARNNPKENTSGRTSGKSMASHKGQNARNSQSEHLITLDPDQLIAHLQKMPSQRRKKVLQRIRKRLAALPEDKQKKMKKVLKSFSDDSSTQTD